MDRDIEPTEAPAEQIAGLQRECDLARREAGEASLTRSRFLAIMSHEIRTPLNGVLGALQLLADNNPAQSQLELIDLARSSAESLQRISNDVIDLSRLETGRLDLESAPFEIAALLEEICDAWRPMAVSKGLNLQLAIDDSLPCHVSGDSERVRQLVDHYLSNAINYTDHGSIRVRLGLESRVYRTNADDLRVRLEVVDSGAGIPREDQKLLFQGYSQAQGASTRQRGGAGLGLIICREITNLMGGSVGASSDPGKGSTFWASFPLGRVDRSAVEGDVPATPEKLPLLRTTRGTEPTVLLAEDSVTNQFIAQAFLEQFGCHVDIAHDGLEAVKAVKSLRYDVVLMDVAMPRMDGLEATRQIRALQGDAARVPILGQTAYVLEEDTSTFLSAGMDLVVNKPLQRAELYAALSAILNSATMTPNRLRTAGACANTIDTAVLDDLKESLTPHQFEKLLERLIEDIDNNGKEAMKSACKGDVSRLTRACHTLKGLGASFGNPELESLAGAIQSACRSDDESRAIAMAISSLETVYVNSLTALKSFQQTIRAQTAAIGS